jgi:hypothetical protein
VSIQRYNPEDHPSERSGDVVECDHGDLVYYADHLAALEAERAKGRIWWCLRAPGGNEWMYPYDPGIPTESGWTCRKVRVVEVVQ